MDWFDRLGAMYMFFNETPALAHDMAMHGPQTDLGFQLAYGLQQTPVDLDVYPADSATEG